MIRISPNISVNPLATTKRSAAKLALFKARNAVIDGSTYSLSTDSMRSGHGISIPTASEHF
jgi:hypothetical protein